MALVPYSAATLGSGADIEALKAMPVRHFAVGDHFLTIEQRWTADGRGGTELGFGGTAFDAAFVLADYLHRAGVPLAGRRVVDLGTGTGLVAIAASLLGAAEVVATDGDATLVADLTARNCAANCPRAWRAGACAAPGGGKVMMARRSSSPEARRGAASSLPSATFPSASNAYALALLGDHGSALPPPPWSQVVCALSSSCGATPRSSRASESRGRRRRAAPCECGNRDRTTRPKAPAPTRRPTRRRPMRRRPTRRPA